MIAFEVLVNGKRVCTAGIDEWGVITAIVTWVRKRPERSADDETVEEELTFDVRGLDSARREHLTWFDSAVKVGHEVSIRIVEGVEISPPQEKRGEDLELEAKAKRRYYERLKREYGG